MEPLTAIKVLEQYGVGAMFIVLFLGTVCLLIKQLQEQVTKQREQTTEVISALQLATDVQAETKNAIKEIKTALEQNTKQSEKTLAFMEGRLQGLRERAD